MPFAFELPISLTPGNTYVIEAIGDPDSLVIAADFNNPYALGQAYRDGVAAPVFDHNFHTWVTCDESLQATIDCGPASGTLPFTLHLDVYLRNLFSGQVRQYAARIDVTLASGTVIANWRAGYLNVHAGW